MITTRTRAKNNSVYNDMRNLSIYVVNLMNAQMVFPQLVYVFVSSLNSSSFLILYPNRRIFVVFQCVAIHLFIHVLHIQCILQYTVQLYTEIGNQLTFSTKLLMKAMILPSRMNQDVPRVKC